MQRVLSTVLLLAVTGVAGAANPSPAEAVLSHEIVRATEEARRNGEASLVELKDGSLLLLYGAHSKPGDWDRGEIRQIRSRDRGKTWSEPENLFSDPKRSLFQCSLARLPSGDLGLTHSSLANGTDAIKVFRRSSDEGKTWSEPIVISDKAHAYTTGPWDKLYVLESGRLLALLHCNLKPNTTKQGGPLGSYAVYSDDDGKTWQRGPAADVLHVAENPHRAHEWGFWEPSLVEHAPGKLLMLARTPNGSLWESRSADNGTTWSMPVKTAVPNPVAPPVLTRVPGTDTLVLIQNPEVDLTSGWHGGPRRALAFRTSTNGGRTWSEPTDLYRATEDKLWVDYPAIRWIDGNLHMVWRHIRQAATDRSATSLYHHVVPAAVLTADRGAGRERSWEADLVVIGGTPGGIACAVRAAREGLSVILVNWHDHLGGIMSSGLGAWDTQYEGRRSPVYDEMRQAFFDFYRRTYGDDSPQYRDALPGRSGHNNGRFEPHVAERHFTDLVEREEKIIVLRGCVPAGVEREGATLKSVTLRPLGEGGVIHGGDIVLRGRVFADATYEGDLATLAKVPYRVGRESRDEFGEPHAGIVFMKPVSQPPDAESARLAKLRAALNLREFTGWQVILPESTGAADPAVQACNYRTPLVTDPANRVPIPKPEHYDPYYIKTLEVYSGVASIPNGKFGWNRPQLLGLQTPYVEADWTERQRIMDKHWETTLALLYFHQHDPTVPEKIRAAWLEYGLAKDEFIDHGHRPYEMYVREARRITARAMFTQHDAMLAPGLGRAPVHADSIAVTEWYMDAHGCTTARVLGSMDEGKAMLHQETFPGQLPWRCLLPQGVNNLLVPVCLGATHVAWGTVRLEPVFMQTGEVAGLAAAIAVKAGSPPAGLDADRLVRELCRRKCMVSFFNDLDVGADDPRVAAAQYFGTKGFFADYDARLDKPLATATLAVWERGLAALRSGTLDPADLVKQVHEAESQDSPPTSRARGEALLAMWQSLEKIDLFEANTGGYARYRIPGIVVTAKRTVLASCEARKSASGDWGTIDILLRRSTDGGRTWGEAQKLSDLPGPKQKNPMALKQKLATNDEVTHNNCVLFADRAGPVHALYCLEYARCFHVRSDDDGLTWSKPVEITKAFDAFRSEIDWKVLATGPAHGIQLRGGRLVVPVWLSTGTGGHAHRPSVTATIYSDDGGATWHRGAIAVPNTPEWINPNETAVVELADGRVMLNVRSESHRHRRLVTTSPDGATGWTAPTFDDALLEPICMASIVRHSLAGENGARNRILFANPHWLERSDGKATPGGSRDRKNVSVKLSYDEGRTWPTTKSLEEGFSGYTDLAVLPDGTILCFYERGSIDGKTSFGTGRLTVARFNLAWLTDGADTGK